MSFEWSTGETSQTLDVTDSGTYTVVVTDADGCSTSDEISIIFNEIPSVNLGADQVICADESGPLLDAGNSGFSYEWSTGETSHTISPAFSGIYWVEVTNENCIDVDSVELTFNPAIEVDLGLDDNICEGTILTLDAGNAGLSYNWSTGESSQNIDVENPGTYSVVVSDADGCTGTDEMTLAVNPLPFTNLGEDRLICQNDFVLLDAGNSGAVEWSTGAITQTIRPSETGVYWVRVSNNCGVAEDTVHITVDRCNLPCILVPTAFSPNEDGVNDVFKPHYDCVILSYNFKVYNRWGELVYESTNPDTGWDGIYKTNNSELGVYVWYIEMERLDDEDNTRTEVHQGNVTLVR